MRFSEFGVKEALPALAQVARTMAPAGMKKTAPGTQNVAQAVGGTAAAKPTTGAGKSMAGKIAQKTTQELTKKLLTKGSKVPFPTQSGQAKEFEIDDVQGDEVTLVNPDAKNKPEEPEKMVYKKKDVETVIGQLSQQQEQ